MTRVSRWGWVITLVTLTGVAGVLGFLLSVGATSQRRFFERHYEWLYWVNVAVAAVLTLVILTAAVRLVVRVRQGRFGSRLLLKLAAIFALVGVVPGLMIYAVSYQFVNRSIETWFDVKLASALEAGLNLGRGTLDAMVSDLGGKTRDAAEQLADHRIQDVILSVQCGQPKSIHTRAERDLGGVLLEDALTDVVHVRSTREWHGAMHGHPTLAARPEHAVEFGKRIRAHDFGDSVLDLGSGG